MNRKFKLWVSLSCAILQAACGGGGDSSPPVAEISRADEGIWSNAVEGAVRDYALMQTIFLRDGTYVGVRGDTHRDNTFYCHRNASYGTAIADGNSISGFSKNTDSQRRITFTGMVSVKNEMNLELTDDLGQKENYSLRYDPIYDSPASLSSIAGNYSMMVQDCGFSGGIGQPSGTPDPLPPTLLNPVISGSTLTFNDRSGFAVLTGSVSPRGSKRVFDVILTTTKDVYGFIDYVNDGIGGLTGDEVPAGSVFKGILLTTSAGVLKDYIQLYVFSDKSAYYYIGRR